MLETKNLRFKYDNNLELNFPDIKTSKENLLILGASGVGKTTFLHLLSGLLKPMNGEIDLLGTKISNLKMSELDRFRGKNIGIVFQKPNPFPKTIYDNVAYGARINNFKGDLDELVETSLKKVVLWDEVKDKLGESGFSLSGGQQQRLCIARTIAAKPEVILMDEPCSALDPISVLKIEELINELNIYAVYNRKMELFQRH